MKENEILQLIKKGDDEADKNQFEEALRFYKSAMALVPEPFMEHEIATEIFAAIGDAYFFMKEYENAFNALKKSMLCPGAPGNSYIRLRRGQIAFELGTFDLARTELACAYMLGGKEIFKSENKKYFDFLDVVVVARQL